MDSNPSRESLWVSSISSCRIALWMEPSLNSCSTAVLGEDAGRKVRGKTKLEERIKEIDTTKK